MKTLYIITLIGVVAILLQGCESSDSPDQLSELTPDGTAYVEDVPIAADNVVLQMFGQDADSEPVDIDGIELIKL